MKLNAWTCDCLLNSKPHKGPLPLKAHFVGMEIEPNKPPRYGKLLHSWFNKPCYEVEE